MSEEQVVGSDAKDSPSIHPVAELLPLGSEEDLQLLAEDIKKNGLRIPILKNRQGEIIDGRRRERACQITGVEPRYEIWDGKGSLVEFVLSLNVHRRHLNKSQRAAIAVDLLPFLEEEAKQRQREAGGRQPKNNVQETVEKHEQKFAQPQSRNPQSRDRAAALLGTNRQYVSDAKRLQKEAPDLLKRVKEGKLTLTRAKKLFSNKSDKDTKHKNVIKQLLQACQKFTAIFSDSQDLEEARKIKEALEEVIEILAGIPEKKREAREAVLRKTGII